MATTTTWLHHTNNKALSKDVLVPPHPKAQSLPPLIPNLFVGCQLSDWLADGTFYSRTCLYGHHITFTPTIWILFSTVLVLVVGLTLILFPIAVFICFIVAPVSITIVGLYFPFAWPSCTCIAPFWATSEWCSKLPGVQHCLQYHSFSAHSSVLVYSQCFLSIDLGPPIAGIIGILSVFHWLHYGILAPFVATNSRTTVFVSNPVTSCSACPSGRHGDAKHHGNGGIGDYGR